MRLFNICWKVNSIALTGFDGDTYLHSIVLMRLTHCVQLPLVNLYKERMVQCPEKYNTLFVGAPLGRPLGMRRTRQKNLLPSCLYTINLSFDLFFCFYFSLLFILRTCICVYVDFCFCLKMLRFLLAYSFALSFNLYLVIVYFVCIVYCVLASNYFDLLFRTFCSSINLHLLYFGGLFIVIVSVFFHFLSILYSTFLYFVR